MVVRPVFSAQCSVFRTALAKAKPSKLLTGRFKHILLLVLLNTEFCVLTIAKAKDCGTHGTVFPVEEHDPIALIQQKLKAMEDSGELTRRNRELQKRTRDSIERPKPVEGIARALKTRIFYYDPTYEVREDLYDHQGQIFARKGTRLNPLETVSLSANLIFFDGDDPEQLDWVKEQFSKSIKNNSMRLILVRGAPLKLAEELGIPVYFDQSGILTRKLGIRQVPAVVSQEVKRLKIEETKISPSRELKIEGDG